MKKLSLLVFLVCLIGGTWAEEMISVSSLSDGACFVYDGEGDQKIAKIASFNQSLSWIVDDLSMQKLKEDINKSLLKYGYEFSDNKYQITDNIFFTVAI